MTRTEPTTYGPLRLTAAERIAVAIVATILAVVGWALLSVGRPTGCRAYLPDCTTSTPTTEVPTP